MPSTVYSRGGMCLVGPNGYVRSSDGPCSCCGCALLYRADPCGHISSLCDPTLPAIDPWFICVGHLCASTVPIAPGRTIRVDGVCFVVGAATFTPAQLPPNARVLPENVVPECLNDCSGPECNSPSGFALAALCSPDPLIPPRYYCKGSVQFCQLVLARAGPCPNFYILDANAPDYPGTPPSDQIIVPPNDPAMARDCCQARWLAGGCPCEYIDQIYSECWRQENPDQLVYPGCCCTGSDATVTVSGSARRIFTFQGNPFQIIDWEWGGTVPFNTLQTVPYTITSTPGDTINGDAFIRADRCTPLGVGTSFQGSPLVAQVCPNGDPPPAEWSEFRSCTEFRRSWRVVFENGDSFEYQESVVVNGNVPAGCEGGCGGASAPVVRWMGMNWYGTPAPVRAFRWLFGRSGTDAGCGCQKTMRDWWDRFSGWVKSG